VTRVLALVTDAYGGRGGIAQAARDVIGALATMETVTEIDVLPRQAVEPLTGLPPKVRQRPPSGKRIAYALRAVVAAGAQPDVVFCNHLYMAPLAALAAQRAKAKCVIQLHGIEIWREPTRAQRKALERADLVLCVSRDTRARALTHCDLQPERAVVLNNTVDSRFMPGDREGARVKFGLGGEFALLIVGRMDQLERYKGHDRVIAALHGLKHPEGRRIVFLIAGDGDDQSRLQTEASKAGVSDRVRFLGQVPVEDLPDLYRAADLFVLPSTGEGFGIVFLEAMACGTPSLGLAAGGAPDALVDGALGIMVGDAEALPDALQAAIAASRPNAATLAAATVSRFGTVRFRERVGAAINVMGPHMRSSSV